MKAVPLALIVASSGLLLSCGGSSSSNTDTSSSSESSSSSSAPNYADYCEKINDVQGFASLEGGTTGGADVGEGSYVIGVSNGVDLRAAVYSANSPYRDKPLTVYIDDLITVENNNGVKDLRIERSDVSIIGRSENAGFEAVAIEVRPVAGSGGVGNIIIRNLKLRLVPQSHGPGDIISLDGRNGPVRNIWIDHNELYNSLEAPESVGCGTNIDCHKDYYDELVSGRSDVGNVTISYNYLHDSWKTSLWGSHDTAPLEVFDRTVTFHHNWWQDTNSRTPLYRYGELHMFNNYFLRILDSGANVRMHAVARIEGNVFEDSKDPIVSQFSSHLGYWDVADNIFENINASGSCTQNTPPCRNAHTVSTGEYVPPYTYEHVLMPAVEVKEYVMENAGFGKIDDCLNLPPREEDDNYES